MTDRVLVIGAGGFGRSVADALLAGSRYTLTGFVDDRIPAGSTVLGQPVLGSLADLPALRAGCALVVVAIGDNLRRQEITLLAQNAGFNLATVVHPQAIISQYAALGAGAMILAGAIVGTEVTVGDGAIVNAGAIVDHHAKVGDFAHLGVGACIAGGARIGARSWLKEGSILRAGQVIGDDCVAAGGAA